MSYPRDLDEYTEAELAAEIVRRREARASGLCDYCGRPPTETPCRFPERHNPPERNCYTCEWARGGDCEQPDVELIGDVWAYCADAGCSPASDGMPTNRMPTCAAWKAAE